MGTLRHIVAVEAPVDRAFRMCVDIPAVCAHFPALFSSAESIDSSTFRVTYESLMGRSHELTVELSEVLENQVISFRIDDVDRPLTGSIAFEAGGRETFITVVICFSPPGARLGDVISNLIKYPHHRLEEGLVSLSEAIENA